MMKKECRDFTELCPKKKTILQSLSNQEWRLNEAETEKNGIINTYLNENHHEL